MFYYFFLKLDVNLVCNYYFFKYDGRLCIQARETSKVSVSEQSLASWCGGWRSTQHHWRTRWQRWEGGRWGTSHRWQWHGVARQTRCWWSSQLRVGVEGKRREKITKKIKIFGTKGLSNCCVDKMNLRMDKVVHHKSFRVLVHPSRCHFFMAKQVELSPWNVSPKRAIILALPNLLLTLPNHMKSLFCPLTKLFSPPLLPHTQTAPTCITKLPR